MLTGYTTNIILFNINISKLSKYPYKIKPHLCQYCINNLFPQRLHYINTRKHGGRDIIKKYSCHQNESKTFSYA